MSKIAESKLDELVNKMMSYIHKYLNEDNECYRELLKIENKQDVEFESNDLEWSLIIEQAWKMAYRQALEDNNISPEERMELEKIQKVGMIFKSDPANRVALNYKMLTSFKQLLAIDKKEDSNEESFKSKWSAPKPTPWDNK